MVALSREDTRDLMANTVPHLPKDSMVLLPKGNMVLHLPKGSTVLLRRGNTRVTALHPLLGILQLELLQATTLLLRLVVPQLAALTKPLLHLPNTSHLDRRAMVHQAGRVVMVGTRLSEID